MKKMIFCVAVLASVNAFAGTKIAACSNDDGTTQVSIYKNDNGSMVAVVGTESFGGSFPTFKYLVTETQAKMPGAPKLFVGGNNFLLTVQVDAAPVRAGFPAHLAVHNLGINTALRCKL